MKITLSDGRSFVLNAAQIAFVVIAALTLLNGFLDSLSYEFADPGNWHQCSFLCYPPDIYGDLLKPSFVAPPFVTPDTSQWPAFAAQYYADNPYVPQHLERSSHVTGLSFLHVTPITMMLHLIIKRLVLAFSPQFVIGLFYLAAISGLVTVCFIMTPTRALARRTSFILGISYPFLMIVSRGNMGALVNGVTLPLFFYFILLRRRLWPAVACLTVAALFRPNVLLLCPVVLCLGFRSACLGSLVAGMGLAAGYALFFHLDGLLYPGYGLAAHLSGLASYTNTYIIGLYGDGFNNSAYGAIKLIIYCFHGKDATDIGGTLKTINLVLALLFAVVLAGIIYLYLWRNISDFAFAFATLACFALTTTIFGVYHLFVFAAFPLLLLHVKADRPLTPADRLILLTSVFVLVPKDYLFIYGISIESILNPLALGVTLGWLIVAASTRRDLSSALVPIDPATVRRR